MEEYLKNACEEIDAGIFSSDALFSPETVITLKEYIARWTRGIIEHEVQEANEKLTALLEKN